MKQTIQNSGKKIYTVWNKKIWTIEILGDKIKTTMSHEAYFLSKLLLVVECNLTLVFSLRQALCTIISLYIGELHRFCLGRITQLPSAILVYLFLYNIYKYIFIYVVSTTNFPLSQTQKINSKFIKPLFIYIILQIS